MTHIPRAAVSGLAPPTAPLVLKEPPVRAGALDFKNAPSIVNGEPAPYKRAVSITSRVPTFAGLRSALQ